MKTLILVVLGIIIEKKFSPRLDYIKESKILIFYYNAKNTRKSFVLWK